MRWISLISSGHSIQMQKNTLPSQVHIEHSPGQTTSWVTNQTSVKKIEIVSSIFSDHNVMRLDINHTHPLTLLVGMQSSTAYMGNSVEIP